MITINENRNERPASKDMTQRVYLDHTGQPTSRPTTPQRNRNKKRWYLTKKEKIALISLGSVAAVLLILAIVIFSIGNQVPDDGRILKGVLAAGVDLGGMTPEEAKFALDEATADTYDKMDMIVSVLDTQITLSPTDTGAKLDIDAVVDAAYNYGRTGSRAERNQAKTHAAEHSVVIPITPHLNLDTDYIRNEIKKLGDKFSSTLDPSYIEIDEPKKPTQPTLGADGKPDTSIVYQTLTIYAGTPEYGLDTAKLYKQVLDGYNTKIFKVEGTCTVVAPESIEQELMEYYNDLCVEPVDAKLDPITYEVTPEIYGYGFNLDNVKEQLANADGPIKIPLTYLAPNLTEELISTNLFKDMIGQDSSPLLTDEAWNANVHNACLALNGLIINSGDTFSFNQALGELTLENGYVDALAWQDKVYTTVMGGGITHVASVLYTAALEADLEIIERHSHAYVPSFVGIGRDAYVDSFNDFSFRNARPDPIRIKAEVVEGNLLITIEGVDTRDYIVEITVKVTATISSDVLYNTMLPDNAGGYTDGHILFAGADGYVVEVYKAWYDKNTEDPNPQPRLETFVCTYSYAPQDSIVVKLQEPTAPVDPITP